MNTYKTIIDTIAAVGTILSTSLALMVIIRENRPRAVLSILWDESTRFKPTILIQNIGSKPVIVSKIIVHYDKVHIKDCIMDPVIEPYDNYVVGVGEKKNIILSSDRIISASSGKGKRAYSLKATIIDCQGKHYSVKRKFKSEEMLDRCFPEGFCSEDR